MERLAANMIGTVEWVLQQANYEQKTRKSNGVTLERRKGQLFEQAREAHRERGELC